ncbi:MAG: hypothetical protein QXU99_05770 [Candidatus Bathyarchaeia archaeon]
MKNQGAQRACSGQVLIIVSLIITTMLLSTALYVTETEKTLHLYQQEITMPFPSYKLATLHTITNALANISNGGNRAVLTTNLDRLKSVINANYYAAILELNFQPINIAPYQNGIYIAWGSNGKGVSSACVKAVFNATSALEGHHAEFIANVTSELTISGSYKLLTGAMKQVDVVCSLLNEGKPALAQNFTFYYEYDGSLSPEEWIQVVSPSIVDYGNGTYRVSFTAETKHRNNDVLVSVHCRDLRGIFTRANVTCIKT